MNIKKNILSRMTRRKNSTPAEPEEDAYEIPPPSAIEPGVPYSAREGEESGYGSHIELLASDEPPRTDSANGADAQQSGDAPALESLTVSVSDESPDAPDAPREAAPFEEYDLDLELLTEPESSESPDEPEPPREHEETTIEVVENAVEATAPEPDIPQENEPETIGDAAPEFEESLAAPVSSELPSEAVLSPAPEPFEGYGEDFEALAVPEPDALPDEAEPLEEYEKVATAGTENVVEASAPEPDIPQQSEMETIGDAAAEHEEPLATAVSDQSSDEAVPSQEDEVSSSIAVAADTPREEPDETSETPIAENGFFPLVRDARGNWRTGKGFSRSELREAGLSLAEAARLRVRVDKRRRNAHPMNVATLEEAKNGS